MEKREERNKNRVLRLRRGSIKADAVKCHTIESIAPRRYINISYIHNSLTCECDKTEPAVDLRRALKLEVWVCSDLNGPTVYISS